MSKQCQDHAHCHWKKIEHTSKDSSIGDFLSVYRHSTFCLCPPGDDPARKAVFDAIVSGCIPVIFHVHTLYNQYPWHIGEEAALDISVLMPGMKVKNNQMRFMDVLMQIPPEVVRAKQRKLAELAPRVQYAMPPPSNLTDIFDETPWDPPFKDAADLILDGMFDRTGHVVRGEPIRIPMRVQTQAVCAFVFCYLFSICACVCVFSSFLARPPSAIPSQQWFREYNNRVVVKMPGIPKAFRGLKFSLN
jgi:hypothetical protein